VEDYFALKRAMRLGFGWSSRETLRNLCCLLWAKSNSERELLKSLFDQLGLPDWDLSRDISLAKPTTESENKDLSGSEEPAQEGSNVQGLDIDEQVPATLPKRGLPPIDLEGIRLPSKSFVFVPHFPLTSRDVAQRWRYVRESELSGPLEEVDIKATIALRCRQGLPGPIVLRPRKRKTSHLLLLVDQQGSMAPFHKFVEIVWDTIKRSARSGDVAVYYFHDVPVEGADDRILASVGGQPFPVLDDVLDQIAPLDSGYVYEDRELLSPIPLPEVLQTIGKGANVVFLSDAGAARRHYDLQRLLDTVAFIKVLRNYNQRCVWLNPLPVSSWSGTTAEQIARYVSMFALDSHGLQRATTVLLGKRRPVENSL
jgi:hypothetical protein